jgi:hypothetical protein
MAGHVGGYDHLQVVADKTHRLGIGQDLRVFLKDGTGRGVLDIPFNRD